MNLKINGESVSTTNKIKLFFLIIITFFNKLLMGWFTLFLLNHFDIVNSYTSYDLILLIIYDLILLIIFYYFLNINPIKIKFRK